MTQNNAALTTEALNIATNLDGFGRGLDPATRAARLEGEIARLEAEIARPTTAYTAAICNARIDACRRALLASPAVEDADTGDFVRWATADERERSIAQARRDGGAGVIEIDGRRCYVTD